MKKTLLHVSIFATLTVGIVSFIGCGEAPKKEEPAAPPANEQPAAQPADSAHTHTPGDTTHKH